MTERIIPFDELMKKVIDQLIKQGYKDSTLDIYRRLYNRIHVFINQRGTDLYTKDAGRDFLNNINVCRSTFVSYNCAVRRLDDYLDGKPYRCHHGNPSDKVVGVYADIMDGYLDECSTKGNAPATIAAKEKTCIAFLNYIEKEGCNDISDLNTGMIARALLIFSNKENYARIRLFLKYLSDKGFTSSDFSGIVPRYKRKQIIPTTYTPEEINKLESSIDTGSDTGRRNLAVVRLATRMGLRSGDIAKLKWSEVDFISGYIHIIQDKTKVPLSLQMPDDVLEALIQHLDNLAEIPEDGYVFHVMTAPYGPITTSVIRHIVNNAFIDACVDTTGKKHGPHAFRSSLASSMVNDGVSYESVRKILGHSDPDVIMHYAKTDIENLRMCSIEPPTPTGLFSDYLTGKKVIRDV